MQSISLEGEGVKVTKMKLGLRFWAHTSDTIYLRSLDLFHLCCCFFFVFSEYLRIYAAAKCVRVVYSKRLKKRGTFNIISLQIQIVLINIYYDKLHSAINI